ncbi:hypothetical protein AHAS_Ahas15G0340000, partial [Arachis hypogaea]
LLGLLLFQPTPPLPAFGHAHPRCSVPPHCRQPRCKNPVPGFRLASPIISLSLQVHATQWRGVRTSWDQCDGRAAVIAGFHPSRAAIRLSKRDPPAPNQTP